MPTLELKSAPRQYDGLYQLRVPDHSDIAMPVLSDTIFGQAPTDDPRRRWVFTFHAEDVQRLMQSCIDVPHSDQYDPASLAETKRFFKDAVFHLAQRQDVPGVVLSSDQVKMRLDSITHSFGDFGSNMPDTTFKWFRETTGTKLILQRLEQVLTVSGISRCASVVRNPRVLSIGCGLAEELPILTRLWNGDVDYTGVDANQKLAKMHSSLTAYYPGAKFVYQDASEVTSTTPDLVIIRNPDISAPKETGANQKNILKWRGLIKDVAEKYPNSAVLITTCFRAEHFHVLQAVHKAWPDKGDSHFKSSGMGFRTSYVNGGREFSRNHAPDRAYIRVIPKASPFYATLVNQDANDKK